MVKYWDTNCSRPTATVGLNSGCLSGWEYHTSAIYKYSVVPITMLKYLNYNSPIEYYDLKCLRELAVDTVYFN